MKLHYSSLALAVLHGPVIASPIPVAVAPVPPWAVINLNIGYPLNTGAEESPSASVRSLVSGVDPCIEFSSGKVVCPRGDSENTFDDNNLDDFLNNAGKVDPDTASDKAVGDLIQPALDSSPSGCVRTKSGARFCFRDEAVGDEGIAKAPSFP